MALQEAEATVLGWLDPERSPQIAWSGYVARADLGAFEGTRHCSGDGIGAVGSYEGGEPLPDVGVVVLALTWGLSMGINDSHGGSERFPDACNSAMVARERVIGLFDARTGQRLVAVLDRFDEEVIAGWQASALSVVHADATVAARATVNAIASPTSAMAAMSATLAAAAQPVLLPTPVRPAEWPTPSGEHVDRDSVPSAFRLALTQYPLLPGSRWTWRVVERKQGVAWRTSLLTETVEAAWLTAPDRLAVRSVRQRRVLHAGLLGSNLPEKEDVWRLLRPEGYLLIRSEPLTEGPYGFFDPDRVESGLVIEGWPYPHGGPLESSAWWLADELAVVTPAGRFDGCRRLQVIGGTAWGSTRAFCPGVGYVRTDSGACTICNGGLATMELVGYEVVLPR